MTEIIYVIGCVAACFAAFIAGKKKQEHDSKERLRELSEKLYALHEEKAAQMSKEIKSVMDHASQTVAQCENRCGQRLIEQMDLYELYLINERNRARWETHETWVDAARIEKLMLINNRKYKVICLGDHEGEEITEEEY